MASTKDANCVNNGPDKLLRKYLNGISNLIVTILDLIYICKSYLFISFTLEKQFCATLIYLSASKTWNI